MSIDEHPKKRILLTGGSSFLGRALIPMLLQQYELSVLEHHNKIADTRVKVIQGSLTSVADWESTLTGIHTIVHCAAITHATNPARYFEVNAIGTRDLIRVAERQGVRHFIFVSTRAIGEQCGAYGASKQEAESYIVNGSISYTILRVGEAYDDSFSKAEGLGSIVSLVKRIPIVPYISNHEIRLAPIHKDDVCKAIVATIENPLAYGRQYTLAGPEQFSFKELLVRIANHYSLHRFFIPVPLWCARIAFYFASDIMGRAAPDQLKRLVCVKEALSTNAIKDLGVMPRHFL